MEPYKNLSGNSDILEFEIMEDSITVKFRDGWHYLYTSESAGKGYIEEMNKLARQGRGLASFISTTIKKKYAKMWL